MERVEDLVSRLRSNATGLLIFLNNLIRYYVVQEPGKAVLHQLYQEEFENL